MGVNLPKPSLSWGCSATLWSERWRSVDVKSTGRSSTWAMLSLESIVSSENGNWGWWKYLKKSNTVILENTFDALRGWCIINVFAKSARKLQSLEYTDTKSHSECISNLRRSLTRWHMWRSLWQPKQDPKFLKEGKGEIKRLLTGIMKLCMAFNLRRSSVESIYALDKVASQIDEASFPYPSELGISLFGIRACRYNSSIEYLVSNSIFHLFFPPE